MRYSKKKIIKNSRKKIIKNSKKKGGAATGHIYNESRALALAAQANQLREKLLTAPKSNRKGIKKQLRQISENPNTKKYVELKTSVGRVRKSAAEKERNQEERERREAEIEQMKENQRQQAAALQAAQQAQLDEKQEEEAKAAGYTSWREYQTAQAKVVNPANNAKPSAEALEEQELEESRQRLLQQALEVRQGVMLLLEEVRGAQPSPDAWEGLLQNLPALGFSFTKLGHKQPCWKLTLGDEHHGKVTLTLNFHRKHENHHTKNHGSWGGVAEELEKGLYYLDIYIQGLQQ